MPISQGGGRNDALEQKQEIRNPAEKYEIQVALGAQYEKIFPTLIVFDGLDGQVGKMEHTDSNHSDGLTGKAAIECVY